MITSLIICSLLFTVQSQSVPEAVLIQNLPDQTQDAYHGWLLTDKENDSHLYYQLFSANNTSFNDSDSDIPLLLYLEGGPGDSSTLVSWSDFGPYGVKSNMNVTGSNDPLLTTFSIYKHEITWTKSYHLLTIDNPIFTGLSFAANGTNVNSTVIAGESLVAFLKRFYQIYEQLLDNPLYIIGHSYGGHWGSYLAYSLMKNHDMLRQGDRSLKIGGLILLCPMVSQGLQRGIADYYYAAGVIDSNRRDLLKNIDDQIMVDFSENMIVDASIGFFQEQIEILNRLPGPLVTINVTLDNVRRSHMGDNDTSSTLLDHFIPPLAFYTIEGCPVETAKNLLNIPDDVTFLVDVVMEAYEDSGDFAENFAYAVEYLLEQGIYVTMLGAQDDGMVPVPGIVNMVSALNWSGNKAYRTSQRKIWYNDEKQVLGNYKRYQNLNLVTLYNSGHLVYVDQPIVTSDFIGLVVEDSWK